MVKGNLVSVDGRSVTRMFIDGRVLLALSPILYARFSYVGYSLERTFARRVDVPYFFFDRRRNHHDSISVNSWSTSVL